MNETQTPPNAVSQEEKLWATLSYLGVLSIVVLLVKKEKFIHDHAKQGFLVFVGECFMFIPVINFLFGWLIGLVAHDPEVQGTEDLDCGQRPAGVATAAVAAEALKTAIDQLCRKTEAAIKAGRSVIILSDRDLPAAMIPIPALLAVSAVNQAVVRMGKRTGAALILETGEPREVHHFALLGGYGAEAVHPYLALDTLTDLAHGDAEKAEKFQ